MDPQELLGLLTARVQRFHLAPGGIPKLTPQDVAHALGMIHNDQARLFARVKYAGQLQYVDGLALHIRKLMLDRAMDELWRIHRKDFCLSMAYLMLAESIDPMCCTWCNGRAEVKPEHGPVILCDACNGSGRRRLRELDRARLLGVTRQVWNNTWVDRYKDFKEQTVDKWEAMFEGALRKRLGA
jgi:hypothetical protein